MEALLEKRTELVDTDNANMWIERSRVAKLVQAQQAILAQMPLVHAINHLVTATALPRYCAQWGNASQRMDNIGKAIEQAGAYHQQCLLMGMAATFPGYLNQLLNCSDSPPSPDTDAVTLITAHKAKGLEWPMVIRGNMKMEDDDFKVSFNTIHVQHPANAKQLLGGQTIVYLPWTFASFEKVKGVSEDLLENKNSLDSVLHASNNFYRGKERLLYVEFTRAQDYLVLPYYNQNRNIKSSCGIETDARGTTADLFTAAHWETMKRLANEAPAEQLLEGHPILVQSFGTFDPDNIPQMTQAKQVTFYNTGELMKDSINEPRFISPSKQHDIPPQI